MAIEETITANSGQFLSPQEKTSILNLVQPLIDAPITADRMDKRVFFKAVTLTTDCTAYFARVVNVVMVTIDYAPNNPEWHDGSLGNLIPAGYTPVNTAVANCADYDAACQFSFYTTGQVSMYRTAATGYRRFCGMATYITNDDYPT